MSGEDIKQAIRSVSMDGVHVLLGRYTTENHYNQQNVYMPKISKKKAMTTTVFRGSS